MKCITEKAARVLITYKESLSIAMNPALPGHRPEEQTKLKEMVDMVDRLFSLHLSNETLEEIIAKQYSGFLKAQLGMEEFHSIVSHESFPNDHCDSNMVMHEAFISITGREFVPSVQEDLDIVNDAFVIARDNRYFN
jgi:hypothetical protein